MYDLNKPNALQMFCEDVFMRLHDESDMLLNASIDKEVSPIQFADLCKRFDPNAYFDTPKHQDVTGLVSKHIAFVATLSHSLFASFKSAQGELPIHHDQSMNLIWKEKMSFWSVKTMQARLKGFQNLPPQVDRRTFLRQNNQLLTVFAEIALKEGYPTTSVLEKLLNEPSLFEPHTTIRHLTQEDLLCPHATKVFLENSPWVSKDLLESYVLKCELKEEVSPSKHQKSRSVFKKM